MLFHLNLYFFQFKKKTYNPCLFILNQFLPPLMWEAFGQNNQRKQSFQLTESKINLLYLKKKKRHRLQ